MQARTLEIYAHLGIVGRALELGKAGVGGNIWAQGRWLANVRLSDAGDGVTPYPYILVLGQDDNELIMGERLRELGMSDDHSGTRPAGISSAADDKRRMVQREAEKAAEELRRMKEQEEKQKAVMAEFHAPPDRTPSS